MQCKNIIIISEDNAWFDQEITDVIDELKLRYEATTSVTTYEFDGVTLSKKDGTGRPVQSADTGVYMIARGTAKEGFKLPLDNPAKAEAFADALLSLADLQFRIRKLCCLACCGVKTRSHSPIKVPQIKVPKSSEEMKQHIWVQHVCQAISKKDNKAPRKLEGLMVSGYSTAVFAPKGLGGKKTQDKEGTTRMRPQIKAEGTELQNYAKRKTIFVWKGGNWAFGKLSDYSDKAEWKSTLAGAEL